MLSIRWSLRDPTNQTAKQKRGEILPVAMLANQTNKSNTCVSIYFTFYMYRSCFLSDFVNASAKESSRCRKKCITWSSKENEFTQQFSCSLPNLFRQSHAVYASVSYLNINETCIHLTSEFWTCSVCPPIFQSHEKIELFQTVYKSKRFFQPSVGHLKPRSTNSMMASAGKSREPRWFKVFFCDLMFMSNAYQTPRI